MDSPKTRRISLRMIVYPENSIDITELQLERCRVFSAIDISQSYPLALTVNLAIFEILTLA